MKSLVISTTLSVLAVTVIFILVGCPNPGSGGGSTAVSVDPVASVTLNKLASADDFSSKTYDNVPTEDKERALLVTGQAFGTVSEFLGAFFMANPDWSPSGTFDMSPDPDSSGFESSTSYSLSAEFSGEGVYLNDSSEDPDGDSLDYVGEALIGTSAYLGATREASSYGIDYPGRVTFEAELAADLDHADTNSDGLDVIEPSSSTDTMPTIEAGAVHAAVNWNLDAKPSYRSTADGPEPKALEAAYAISARVSAAFSVAEATVDNQPTDGNYLVDFSFEDDELLNISDSMTEQQMEDYLTNKLEGDFSLSITVSDGKGASITYDYTISDIVSILSNR